MLATRTLWVVLLCGMLLVPAAAGREWTDSTGKHKTEAEFVSEENGVVTLKKPDGQTIHLPLAKLSQADQDFIKNHAASTADGKPAAAKRTIAKPAALVPAALPTGIDAAAVKQATEAMNELFKSDFAAAKSPSQRAKLAKQLLQVAEDTKDDRASQYVLLRKSADLATAAGQADGAFAAIEQLAAILGMSVQGISIETLDALNRQAKADHAALAKRAEPLIEKSLDADDYDSAVRLATVMVAAARSAKDAALLKSANARLAEATKLRDEANQLVPSRKTLETAPLDPQANRIVGKFLCFAKRDWEHGLPMIGLGDDDGLKKIAALDLKADKSTAEMVALGDSWSALPGTSRMRQAAQQRADYWYRQALPAATGVVKIKLEKRLGADPSGPAANSIGMKLVLIPAGEFEMGDSDSVETLEKVFPDAPAEHFKNSRPQHHVRITKPFHLGVYPVTVGQFSRFVFDVDPNYTSETETSARGGTAFNRVRKALEEGNKYNWHTTGFQQDESHPVVNVTWRDAVAFCEWLGRREHAKYRLPTDAEWEYACRAGTKTLFYNGDDPEKLVEIGNVADGTFAEYLAPEHHPRGAIAAKDGYAFTSPVGKFRPNAWGLYDMCGNVTQWCQDWYDDDYYAHSPADDPQGPVDGRLRVARGGNWSSSVAACRSAGRAFCEPSIASCATGFRVVRVVP